MSDVLPAHALLSAWEAQTDSRMDDFEALTGALTPIEILGATLLTLEQMMQRIVQGQPNAAEQIASHTTALGARTLSVHRTWMMTGQFSAPVLGAARDVGIALILCPDIAENGVHMSLSVPDEYTSQALAIGACVPLNLLALDLHENGVLPREKLFETLRREFWEIQSTLP